MQSQTVNVGIAVAPIRLSVQGAEEVPVLLEPSFYRELSLAAKRLGIHLYVFCAEGYQPLTGQLKAYCFERNRFTLQTVALPDIIYDRCFFTNASQRISFQKLLASLSQRKSFQLLNAALPAKLEVYHALSHDALLQSYLPQTWRFQSTDQLIGLTRLHPEGIVMKPAAGMQGRGLIHIKRTPNDSSIEVNGRSKQNRTFALIFKDESKFNHWISRFTGLTPYLIQPYLELRDEKDNPFDIRVLLQKNEKGQWALSGTAARSGQSGSLTSNLHGGGDARPALQVLNVKFGRAKSERLLEEIHTISKQTGERIEQSFGRFAELGLDFGIDRSGRLWLIEVNSKPGRSSFRLINDKKAEQLSIRRPLQYARLLSRRLQPSFVANETANGRFHFLRTDNQLRPFNVQEVHQ